MTLLFAKYSIKKFDCVVWLTKDVSSDTEPESEEPRNDAYVTYQNAMALESIESTASSVTEELIEPKEEVKEIDLPPTYEEVINNDTTEL